VRLVLLCLLVLTGFAEEHDDLTKKHASERQKEDENHREELEALHRRLADDKAKLHKQQSELSAKRMKDWRDETKAKLEKNSRSGDAEIRTMMAEEARQAQRLAYADPILTSRFPFSFFFPSSSPRIF
jgi:hypothetical protein